MKVKYRYSMYSVNWKDFMYIKFYKGVLKIKRTWRRIKDSVNVDKKNYSVLIILWIIWGIISFFWGRQYKVPRYTLGDTIWELKNSFFTSVIVVIFFNIDSYRKNHRPKLEKQHKLYVDTMYDFHTIFKPFLADKLQDYMPFYNKECLQDTICFLQKSTFEPISEKQIEESILKISNRLEVLEKESDIIGADKKALEDSIATLKKILPEFNYNNIKDQVIKLTHYMFIIVNNLRVPWRKDIEIDMKILHKLENDKNNMKYDFYSSMLLYGHKMEPYYAEQHKPSKLYLDCPVCAKKLTIRYHEYIDGADEKLYCSLCGYEVSLLSSKINRTDEGNQFFLLQNPTGELIKIKEIKVEQ